MKKFKFSFQRLIYDISISTYYYERKNIIMLKYFYVEISKPSSLARAKQSYDRKSSSYDHHKAATLPSNPGENQFLSFQFFFL